MPRHRQISILAVISCWLIAQGAARADHPLPSWNEGSAKRAIVDFVSRVTKPGGPDFVPVAKRIATFDNDGTLWCEKPVYVQFAFIESRLKFLVKDHPEWRETQPFKGVLEGDFRTTFAGGPRASMELILATHTGMTTEDFETTVREWLARARHPRFDRPYTELVYQPMLELLSYLRANEFKTYIVSGGAIEFMRPWTERVYGIPPEQVVGSTFKLKYEFRDGKPVLMRLPEIDFVDDKAGKPAGIQQVIGRRPIAAFGNSDGDLEMLQWTTMEAGPRLGLIVHHTDADREWAYDRDSPVGRLDKALDEAPKRGWIVMDMKKDWKTVFASPKAKGSSQPAARP